MIWRLKLFALGDETGILGDREIEMAIDGTMREALEAAEGWFDEVGDLGLRDLSGQLWEEDGTIHPLEADVLGGRAVVTMGVQTDPETGDVL